MSALCQRRTHAPIHSIISLAVASGACATFRPSAFAVFKFMPNSNLVGLAPRLRTTRKIKAIRKGNCDQRNGVGRLFAEGKRGPHEVIFGQDQTLRASTLRPLCPSQRTPIAALCCFGIDHQEMLAPSLAPYGSQ